MRTVALFCSLPDEPPTAELLHRWQGEMRLVLPVVEGYEMYFREYTGDGDLAPGAFGIPEPQAGAVIPPSEIDVMLVPGTAFDKQGNRHGRGRGYYDRYLSQPAAARIHKIGVCLPHRLHDEIAVEPHDVRMDEIITTDGKLGKSPQ